MSNTDPDDSPAPQRPAVPDQPAVTDGGPPAEGDEPNPTGSEVLAEFVPLPPEPAYEVVDPSDAAGTVEVVQTICWWCGDPANINNESLCPSCELRKRERDRKQEAERERRRERARAEYDFEYEERHEEDEEEFEAGWYASETRASARRDRDDELNWSGPLQGVMMLYVVLMVVSLGWGASLLSRRGDVTQDDLLRGTAVVEVLDTILVLLSLACVTRTALPDLRPGVRRIAWGVGLPVLAALIGLNLLYTAYLREALNAGEVRGEIPLTLFTVLLVCVQPAVIEELFFRYVAFGGMYRAAGLHATVWITGMMFAVMHIYNPLGVPYLFLAGVVFGYARVWGGLGLPIVMHFIHNFVILALESGR